MLEFLDESPWVKFKPNSRIVLPVNNGPDFDHGWETDGLGFKNMPELHTYRKVAAVAIGDSFVEGMGVPVDKTWSAIISGQGFLVYNFGVQGFSPQQMVGTLTKWGGHFEPELVLFGYTPGFEPRTLNSAGANQPEPLRGGIARIDRYMREVRRRETYFFKFINAVLDLAKLRLTSPYVPSVAAGFDVLQRYRGEVTAGTPQFNSDAREFQLTKEAILDAKTIAEARHSKLVVLLFAHRNLVYHRRVTGHPPPKNQAELRITEAVKEFCRLHGIEVVSTYERLAEYVESLQEPVQPSSLPYFVEDGHLNVTGNQLVAEVVLDYLRQQQEKTKPVQ